jgi:hypothetical protein
MRATGKYWYLIVGSNILLLSSSVLVSRWNDNTSAFELWFDGKHTLPSPIHFDSLKSFYLAPQSCLLVLDFAASSLEL